MTSATNRQRQNLSKLIAAVVLSLIIAALLGESVRRLLDGYAFDSLALGQRSQAQPARRNVSNEEVKALAKAMIIADGPGLPLFEHSPTPPTKGPVNSTLSARAIAAKQSRYHVNFVFNETFIRSDDGLSYLQDDYPEDIFVFTSPNGTRHPRYRHYPASHLSIGYKTNSQGWRGLELSLNKPKNTIRLVGLGDSTTLHQGGIGITYLDYVQHWLQSWVDTNGFDIRIETLNTGREAISSEDVKSIFIHEAQPFEPDYVLFYGLGNQWDIHRLVNFSEDVDRSWDGATSYYQQSFVDRFAQQILQPLTPYSASAKWLLDRFQANITEAGREPRKPKQTWSFPVGISESNPTIETLITHSPNARVVSDLSELRQLTDESDARLFVQTFKYFVYDGMELPLPKASGIFNYLNYGYFPYSYKNLRRAIDYLNRIYAAWAAQNDVTLIDVARQIPYDHRFFLDAMHNTQLGVKLRAWAVFQGIFPQFKTDLENGRLPRADQQQLSEHPFPLVVRTIKKSDLFN